ncbi:MAG TPA: SDR family NAD(P)-dependent oxidoreductase [Polyangiales bacterium]|nr:SDR family NAD(P)-dependent oxidoreductase [Polyangiales bacterium]
MPKRVLVTGAAGFIGSSAVDALLARGDEVVGLDSFDRYYDPALKRRNLESALRAADRFALVEGDVRDTALVKQVCSENAFDAVLHLAALAGVRASIGEAQEYFSVNVQGSIGLLDAARDSNVGNFVFASSSSVYGASEASAFVETDPCDRPLAPYPASKRAVELLGHSYHHLHGLSFTGLRFFSVYGPRCRPDLMQHQLLTSIAHGRTIELFGGDLRRDFTFIDDIVAGVLSAIDRPLGYELVNLGRGEPVALGEFIQTLEQLSGARAHLRNAPKPSADARHTCADIGKARRLLDYAPATSLKDGLRKLWEWYSSGE